MTNTNKQNNNNKRIAQIKKNERTKEFYRR